ncbi:MAG TPA: ATP-binding protein [Thermomicrobiales bacterium]|nr:ATP-binding protein [Thermomicrobiales bacterium]
MRNRATVRSSRSPASLVVLTSGALALLLGLAVIVSWHARFESLLQLRPGYQEIAYRTAIGLAFTGLAVILLVLGRANLARATALAVVAVSLLAAIEDVLPIEIGISRLLANPYVLADAAVNAGIAPQTAIGLTIANLAIVLASVATPYRHRSFLLAIAGSLIVAIGAVALAGYLTGFEHATGWGRFTKMSVQMAFGFLALGTGIFALGWGDARSASRTTPRWLSAPVAIGVATASILFCQALINFEDRQIELAAETEAATVQREVESEVAASIAMIDRIALRWGNNGRPVRARWESDVRLHFDSPTLYQAIEWVDPFYEAQWVVPPAANAQDIGANLRETPELLNTLAVARNQRQTVVSPAFDRGRGELEIAVAHAIYVNDTFDGFIVGFFRVNDLFGMILNEDVAPTSSVAVSDRQRRVFTRDISASTRGEDWAVEIPATIGTTEWSLRVWPGTVSPQRSILPYGALIIGFIVAGLLGLVTWLLQQAAERARAVQLANVTLQVEVAERTRAEEELRHSTGALERSNRSLQEFAYVASHDLKSPLVSLQGLATMLKEDAGDKLDGDARLYLDRIVANATKMRNLLDDLLELSRVGREDIPVSAVPLDNVIDGVTDQLHHILAERSAQVVVSEPLPTVAANPVRLHQVFANLIDNALKYTPLDREPRIEIGAVDAGQTWRISVSDNGAGIPPEHHDKIFTMFQRLPKGRAMNPTGTGMGLAIISRIVEGNGGQCWIADSDEGGTTFCLTFPKPESHHLSHVPRAPQPAGVA